MAPVVEPKYMIIYWQGEYLSAIGFDGYEYERLIWTNSNSFVHNLIYSFLLEMFRVWHQPLFSCEKMLFIATVMDGDAIGNFLTYSADI